MKPSGIGGMAVIEGVMMKNKDEYAVAVRKPNNEIVVEKSTHKDFANKVKLFKLPIFRGMLAFVDSMVVGIKVINFSASFFDEDEEQDKNEKKDKQSKKKNSKKRQNINEVKASEELSVTDMKTGKDTDKEEPDKNKKENQDNTLLMVAAVLISIVMSVALFMVLPVVVSNLFSRFTDNQTLLALLEGLLRLTIFIGYVIAVSHMPEIKRVFMYHGAEHKTINCLENGFELTVENVRWQSKQHKRCGTSFMLLVMIISLIFFIFLPTSNLIWRILSRVLLVPIIAGVSYEFIRLAGKSENILVNIISKPGLWMQGLTTKEPDDSMIEVAIQSVETVFDWRRFLETSVSKEINQDKKNKNKGTRTQHQNKNITATAVKPSKPSVSEEEDDEILKALDRYLVVGENESYHEGDNK